MSEDQPASSERPINERPTKGVKALREQDFHSYSSYWPLALALAMIIALVGVMTSPIVLGIGVVLIAVAIIGWGLERR